MSSSEVGNDQKARLANLRNWNIAVGILHLAQAVAILALSNGFSIPLVAAVQSGPPGTALTKTATFFDVRFSWAIAFFLGCAAIDHLAMATVARGWYERNLAANINYARWIEYSVSASVMVVLIAMLPGITNFYAVVAIFAVNAAMILFGLLMERENQGRNSVTWWPFIFGCIVGIVPWCCIVIALIVSSNQGEGVPGFVYGIFVSLFVLFNCFALNQWLQYRRRGRFVNYLYGEKIFLVLSLVAKTLLAWQVFIGTLN
ncbi:MAG: heliorhodopsin HeR [Acidimicrobiia bacterium]